MKQTETMRAGFALLAQPDGIVEAAHRLLDPTHLSRLATTPSPFGDGHAATRIAALTLAAIHRPAPAAPPAYLPVAA